MAYVPELDVDVFISYCHADNLDGWVTSFEKALADRLCVLLGGKKPTVWRDKRKLSGEHNFTEEIKLRLERSAILVLVVSPSYLSSDFCRLERTHFSAHSSGGIKIGTRLKIVKAIKLPAENDLHHSVVKDALGFKFFHGETEQDAIEYFPGDRDFVLEIDNLAKGLRNILRDMCNSRMPVYVAEPPPAKAKPAWERLRAELESRGFRVLPTIRWDESCEREVLLRAMKPAVLSVHLLGPALSEFSALQMEIARDLKTSTIVWLPPGAKPEPRREEFLEKLPGFTILRTTPYWDLAEVVSNKAKPVTAASATFAVGPAKIYLICDRKEPDDAKVASILGEEIKKKEQMDVFFPEVDQDPAIVDEQHDSRLAECDGVLLYWGRAGKEWFDPNRRDLVRADRLRRHTQAPFRSRAILLDDPDSLENRQAFSGLVLRYRQPALKSIEPFLAPLRAGGSAGVGI